MKIKIKRLHIKLKGLRIFNLVITTKKRLDNMTYVLEAEEELE